MVRTALFLISVTVIVLCLSRSVVLNLSITESLWGRTQMCRRCKDAEERPGTEGFLPSLLRTNQGLIQPQMLKEAIAI